jgi:hypothetical protein
MEPIEALDKKPKEEQAELAAYRTPKGELYVPGVALQRALVGGATYSKGKGRASLQKPAAACLMVDPEALGLGTKDLVRHRPRIEEWEVEFTLTWDETLLKETEVRRIVDDAGSRCGLLDFRPATKGPFGRFVVTKWEH